MSNIFLQPPPLLSADQQNNKKADNTSQKMQNEDDQNDQKSQNKQLDKAIKTFNNLKKQKDVSSSSYHVGSFSKFARGIQSKLNEKNDIIQKVVKEAIMSYELKIKQNRQNTETMLSHQSLAEGKSFKNDAQIKNFIKNPIIFQFDKIQKQESWQIFNINNFLTQFIKKKLYLFQLALIDDKLMKIDRINYLKRFYDDGYLYLATNSQNLYIKMAPNTMPTKVMFKNGKFMSLPELQGLQESMKYEILNMVILYLKSIDILVSSSETQNLINYIGQKFESISKPKS